MISTAISRGSAAIASSRMWCSAPGMPGRGLVEQQHARRERERERDFHQALAAVGQLGHRPARVGGQAHRLDQPHRLGSDVGAQARGPQRVAARPQALGDRDRDVLEHREAAEQLVDLERAHDAALDAPRLREPRHVLAAEHHPAARGRQRAREQVDEGGLARAVGADQRVARPRLEPEVDRARDLERAEALGERARFQQRRAHRAPPRRRQAAARPRMPLRA